MILPLAGFMQTLADLAVIGVVLGLAAYGATSGLFIGTLIGMQALAAVIAAVGFTEPLAGLLVSLDMPPLYAFPVAFGLLAVGVAVATRLLIGRYVPTDAVGFPPLIDKVGGALTGGVAGLVTAGGLLISLDMPPLYAFPVAFGLLAVGVAVATRLLIGRYVPTDAVGFPPLIDKVGGALTGGVAGLVTAGGLLIALSILPLPASLQVDAAQLRFDPGQGMLKTFARIVEPEADQRKRLLNGDDWEIVGMTDDGKPAYPEKPVPPESDATASTDAQKVEWVPPPTKIWSEPYADTNNNDLRGDDEVYLDVNGDGQFSPYAIRQPQIIGDPVRFVGLLDRYRLHQWKRWHITEATWDDLYPPGSASDEEAGVDKASDDSPQGADEAN